jgi:hypothetical protein
MKIKINLINPNHFKIEIFEGGATRQKLYFETKYFKNPYFIHFDTSKGSLLPPSRYFKNLRASDLDCIIEFEIKNLFNNLYSFFYNLISSSMIFFVPHDKKQCTLKNRTNKNFTTIQIFEKVEQRSIDFMVELYLDLRKEDVIDKTKYSLEFNEFTDKDLRYLSKYTKYSIFKLNTSRENPLDIQKMIANFLKREIIVEIVDSFFYDVIMQNDVIAYQYSRDSEYIILEKGIDKQIAKELRRHL